MGSYIGRSPENELFTKAVATYEGDGSTKDFGIGASISDGFDLDVWVANVHQQFGANQAYVVRFATINPDDRSVTTRKLETDAVTDEKLSTTFPFIYSGKFGNFAGANLVVGTIEVSTKGRISNVANLNVKDLDFSGIPTGGGSVAAGRLYKESNNIIFIKT